MEELNNKALSLRTKMEKTFDDYLEGNRYVGIMEFMMLCTEASKIIEEQRLLLLENDFKTEFK